MFIFIRAIFHFWASIINLLIGEPIPKKEDNSEKPFAPVIITMEDLDITEIEPAPIDTDEDKLCKVYTIVLVILLCFIGLHGIFLILMSIAFAS